MAHHAHALAAAKPAAPAPVALPASPKKKKRPRRDDRGDGGIDGLALGGLIVSGLGLMLFCIPIAAIPLGAVGVVMSLVSLSQDRGGWGQVMAYIGLGVGFLAVAASGIIVLLILADAGSQQRRNGDRFGGPPPRPAVPALVQAAEFAPRSQSG